MIEQDDDSGAHLDEFKQSYWRSTRSPTSYSGVILFSRVHLTASLGISSFIPITS